MRYGIGPVNELRNYLDDTDFPAEKDEIKEYLILRGAPAEALAVANRMADKTYESLEEVVSDVATYP